MAAFGSVLNIVGVVAQVALAIALWRAMESHQALTKSIKDYVALQVKKDKRENSPQ